MIESPGLSHTEAACTDMPSQLKADILGSLGCAVIATDLSGAVTYVNSAAEKLYGWTAAETLGRNIAEVTPVPDTAVQAADITESLRRGESWAGELVVKRQDGSTFPAQVINSPVHDRTGALVGLAGVSWDVSELKLANAALLDKTALLEVTLGNMDQGLIAVDAEDRVALWNGRALQLLGLTADVLAGRPTLAQVKAAQRAGGEFLEPSAASDSIHSFASDPPVYQRTRPDGSVLEFRTVPLPNGGAVRTYTDVTVRYRAEAEVRASEKRLQQLLHLAPGFVAIGRGPTHVFEMVNPAYERLVGRRALVGKPVGEVMPELVSQGYLDLLDTVYSTGEPIVRRAAPIWFNDDQTPSMRFIDFVYQPIKGADGRVTGIFAQGHDVTEMKVAQDELQRNREELQAATEAHRTLLEHSLDVICALSETGVFSQVSSHALEVWGYGPGELIGLPFIDLLHPEDLAKTQAMFSQVRLGYPTSAFENRFVRKNGSVVPLLWSLVWSEQHQTTFAVARDLTERLTNEERLRQAHRMEAIGQLTGGLAHDFNNLLTIIMGNAEILMEGDCEAPLSKSLASVIVDAAERGAELTQGLLAFARRQSLEPVRISLEEVVHGMLPLLERTLGEQVDIRTKFDASGLSALTDKSLLESAILNLAVNARDAMPKGGVLKITTGARTAGPNDGPLPIGQSTVFVTVADSGTGMSSEIKGRAFEPFFTTKGVGKGSGLGLSMVYGFASQSGGHVRIDSEPGEGTSVTILLPGVTSERLLAVQGADDQPVELGKERVLVVEDEVHVRQFVTAQLLNLGYEVTASPDGRAALAILETDRDFDLLLTDVVLPNGISGVDLARAAKDINPELKVVLTSGYSEEVFREHGRLDDQTPLLRKPYKRRELARVLRVVLGNA